MYEFLVVIFLAPSRTACAHQPLLSVYLCTSSNNTKFPHNHTMSDYERIRFERLQQVITKAVEQTIKKSLMPEQLQQCFPSISAMEGGQEALETARKQIQKYFHSMCTKQFEHTLNNRDIERKLDDLDEIIQAAQRRRDLGVEEPLQVDQLSAEQLIGASTGPAKEDAVKKLQLIHEQLVLDNQQLYEELKLLAEEGDHVKSDILLAIAGLSSGIDELKRQDFDEKLDALSKEIFGS